jgi:SPP1 family predicted phage head-tail adaptor
MKYNKNEVTGKMRDRIILQNVNRSRSLTGFALESWADVATIWAFAESKLPGSNETIIEGKNTAKNICDFTIRYISSITEESRVVFKNKIYQVKNIKISHDRRFISFQGVYYDSYSTVIGLQLCSASLLAQSSLSAALMRVIKYQASLNAFGSVSADINFVQKVASSLNANGLLSGDISFVQKVQASLLTSANVTGNLTIPKTFNASLLATGTTTADLTVQAAASLLLDLYPNAAAAYSLRKLRTAYTGSAVRVRASTSGAEGDVSFDVNSTISASSTVTVTAVGTSGLSIGQQVTFSTFWNAGGSNQNVFVTTWYDQSGNAKNATQATQASQPQIVNSGNILIKYNKPNLELISKHLNIGTQVILNDQVSIFGVFNSSVGVDSSGFINYQSMPVDDPELRIGNQNFINDYYNGGYALNNDAQFITGGLYSYTRLIGYVSRIYRNNNLLFTSSIRSGALSSGVNEFTIGRYNRINANRNGNISELIVYANDQSANIVNINTNINTHYAIY